MAFFLNIGSVCLSPISCMCSQRPLNSLLLFALSYSQRRLSLSYSLPCFTLIYSLYLLTLSYSHLLSLFYSQPSSVPAVYHRCLSLTYPQFLAAAFSTYNFFFHYSHAFKSFLVLSSTTNVITPPPFPQWWTVYPFVSGDPSVPYQPTPTPIIPSVWANTLTPPGCQALGMSVSVSGRPRRPLARMP